MTTRSAKPGGLDLLAIDQAAAPPAAQPSPASDPAAQPSPASACQPDEWDANGRLISNDRNNAA